MFCPLQRLQDTVQLVSGAKSSATTELSVLNPHNLFNEHFQALSLASPGAAGNLLGEAAEGDVEEVDSGCCRAAAAGVGSVASVEEGEDAGISQQQEPSQQQEDQV